MENLELLVKSRVVKIDSKESLVSHVARAVAKNVGINQTKSPFQLTARISNKIIDTPEKINKF